MDKYMSRYAAGINMDKYIITICGRDYHGLWIKDHISSPVIEIGVKERMPLSRALIVIC